MLRAAYRYNRGARLPPPQEIVINIRIYYMNLLKRYTSQAVSITVAQGSFESHETPSPPEDISAWTLITSVGKHEKDAALLSEIESELDMSSMVTVSDLFMIIGFAGHYDLSCEQKTHPSYFFLAALRYTPRLHCWRAILIKKPFALLREATYDKSCSMKFLNFSCASFDMKK